MKLAFDLSVVSSRQVAVLVWLLVGAACVSEWPLSAPWMRLVLGLAGLVFGAILANKRLWIVNQSAAKVLLQIQDTLQATCVEHQVIDNSVQVTATGTKANIRRFGPFSCVEFQIVDPYCNKERFLLEVMTKYLRFIGKKDADG